ncbi:MAG: quinoprotein relay system zinc metallohydrolase 1 [bacterium]|nr:quinoprotein relay system zinc metallohydrolase 1 [bacterium]
MILSRRTLLGAMVAALPATGRSATQSYRIDPVAVADGVWMIHGADAPMLPANGGAIANIAIIATPVGTVLVDSGPSLRYGQALKGVAEALTAKPVVRVYLTHLHPDHGMGTAAFDPAIVAALPQTISDMTRDGRGFSDALYRLLGDWMRGTDVILPGRRIDQPSEDFGGRVIRLLPLAGHSAGDLALLDERTGTLIGGDLLFHDRAPSTPTANLAQWRASLDQLTRLPHRGAIPGHGPYDPSGTQAIAQTRDWIDWLEATLTDAVRAGLDMVEAGDLPIPARLAGMAAARYELQRSVSHLYPGLEATLLPRIDMPAG